MTLLIRPADRNALGPVQLGVLATPAILDIQFQPDSPADTSP